MLPSWRNRIRVVLQPTQIVVACIKRGWRPQASEPQTFTFEPMPGEAAWPSPLAALRLWLQEAKLGSADIELVMADQFVRYALIPPSSEVNTPTEEESFSRICFEKSFGDVVADLAIRVDHGEYGKPRIAFAVERALLEALAALAREYKLRLMALQPHFVHVFNGWRVRQNGDHALLAVADSTRCILATFRQGAWHSIRAVTVAHAQGEDSLQQAIERECLLQGLTDAATIHRYVPNLSAAGLINGGKSAADFLVSKLNGEPVSASLTVAKRRRAMPAIHLDFARGLPPIRLVGYVLLTLGIIAGVVTTYFYVQLHNELESWQSKWQSLQHAREKSEAESARKNTPEGERLQAELKGANKIIARLATSWDGLFRAVESVAGEDITLLTIEPDTERNEIQITAEAKNFTAMLDYLKRIQALPSFAQPQITNHQIQQQDPQRPVRFSLTAKWVDAPAKPTVSALAAPAPESVATKQPSSE